MGVGVQKAVAEDHLCEELRHGSGDLARGDARVLQRPPVCHFPAVHPLHGHHAPRAQVSIDTRHAHPRQLRELRQPGRVGLLPPEVCLALQVALELGQEPPEALLEFREEPSRQRPHEPERHQVGVDLRLDPRVLNFHGDLCPSGQARPVDLRQGGHRGRPPLEGLEGLAKGPPEFELQRPSDLAEAPRTGRVLKCPEYKAVLFRHLRLLGSYLPELHVDAPVGAGQA